MHTTRIAALGATALIAGGLFAGNVSAVGAPSADTRAAGPAVRFDKPQQNPYFPLRPGTVTRLRGSDEGERFRERVRVTHRTKKIQGVTTRVVRDVVRRLDGSISEKTDDWYATDNDGNVWYFGERTATYDRHGRVESREGSWNAGVDGAVRGRIMPADPRPTDAYRQEFYKGHAEDQAWIVQRNTRIKVPYGTLDHVVRTFEWTRLERGVMSVKFYAPGLGIVRERDLAGGDEIFELVSVKHR
jgi:hypothetical protein